MFNLFNKKKQKRKKSRKNIKQQEPKKRKKRKGTPITRIIKFLGEDPEYGPKKKELVSDDPLDKTVQNQLRFVSWVQNFTKRIVVVVFGIYILVDLITLIAAIFAMAANQDSTSVNTLITEMNTTFRDVIGGYLVKAACENVSGGIEKVLSIYLEKRAESKNSSDDESEDEDNSAVQEEIANELAMPDKEPDDVGQD